MNELKRRLKKLDGLSNSLDAILLFSENPNYFYLGNTDVQGAIYYDFSKITLFTNVMERSRARKSWIKDIRILNKKELQNRIKKKKIGVDKTSLKINDYEKIKLLCSAKDISADLEKARIIKTPYEIRSIKKACKISEKVYNKSIKEITKKITEIEMKGIIENNMHKEGVTPSFPTIVAAGKNSSEPHHVSDKTKLKKPIVIDYGVRYKGYISDITRTIGSKNQLLLEKVIEEVYSKIKPGVAASSLDKLTRKLLKDKAKYFIHGLGHGIGLAVHERPWLSTNSKDKLKPGMTFTIEPGIYHKEGIRIENDVLMKKDGIEILSDF